ncbi:leucine-rich repeat domain-containing protein [Algibacter sp. L4_22]|uniref:leucine-rich repeat domain-containing protein n=1 Tax=Algibacter sp. L4_22 TaxID=2942477 RepID=UPI00201B5D5C|nr:leucine-rich repeat domain-containing protein [Algibacter sp. L4_22]MCL5129609.1 leucine-rich repeat domain-containing protein [Algibacter sp. L4_22]
MKKTLLLFITILTITLAGAQAVGDVFTVDGINYIVTAASPNNEVAVTGMDTPIANIVIPATVIENITGSNYTMNVLSIGESAFSGVAVITSVMLPSSVVTLDNKAFELTSSLTTINLENVVTFGGSVFAQSGIIAADLSSAVSLAGGYDFYFCASLVDVTNFSSATTIGNGAFRRVTSLGELNIPSSVNSIGNQLFRQMSSLTQVQLNWGDPANDVTIDSNTNVFGNIDPLEIKFYVPVGTKAAYEAIFPWNLALPANIIEGDMPESTVGNTFTVAGINYTVTSDDPKEARVSGVDMPMAAITVPLTVTDPGNSEVYDITSIGGGAFLEDATVTSVVLPTSVTLLSSDAFSGCVNLETINLENIVTIETQNVFFNCPKLTTANLAAATSIGNFAFHNIDVGDNVLSSISIPSMVTIGGSSFRTSNISSIDIPATVTSIGSRAFRDCMSLTAIQVNWAATDIPVLVGDVFENLTASGITLYVPTGTSGDYAAADVWKDFNIVEGTLSSKSIALELGFTMYPNPTNGIVNVRNNNNTNVAITVYDLNGRALLNKKVTNTTSEINITNLASGVYLFKVKSENGEFVKRILKQ